MRRSTLCLIVGAVLGGCESAADPVEPASGSGDVFELAAASGAVDESRLNPPLSTNFNWRCHLEAGVRPVCIGQGPSTDNTDGWVPADPEAAVCDGGRLIYHNQTVKGIGVRHYDSDYRLTDRRVHWIGSEHFSLASDGSGATASGESNFFEGFVYAVPADESTITETVRGTDSKAATDQPPHELIFLNKGEVRFTPDGNLEVLSGRWDFVDDFEGAVQRLCAALQ
jgi:hypothetical protein